MPLIDSNHQRAALLVLLLGVALVIALTPYATGLLGIPVLYAVFAPVPVGRGWGPRPRLAASLVVALALFLIVVPGVSFAGLIVNQAQEIATGVIRNPLLGRLRELRLGGIDLGPRLADLGATVVAWIGSPALGPGGTPPPPAPHLPSSPVRLPHLPPPPHHAVGARRPYIPCSAPNTRQRRERRSRGCALFRQPRAADGPAPPVMLLGFDKDVRRRVSGLAGRPPEPPAAHCRSPATPGARRSRRPPVSRVFVHGNPGQRGRGSIGSATNPFVHRQR